ncbi:MAG: prolyl oligopeptidase family serine peptidase [Candidatus Tectomicrobia bacterium]|nr:prolyl oligopeptidase family serine peptidase [Candidatus Tectomicrobia bacterium]
MEQQTHALETQITKIVRLNYLLFLPQGYQAESNQKWPLILFLHGVGERGDDLELVKQHGIPKLVDQQANLPFIIVSPQCPKQSSWPLEVDALNALIDDLTAKHAVDVDRIYLTGLSTGGSGTWELATAYPSRFAAIAPLCGVGDPEHAYLLKAIPAWVFHGAKDDVVKPEESEQMVEALKGCGGNVQFTLYPEADHDVWTETYGNPELYEWFLNHSR